LIQESTFGLWTGCAFFLSTQKPLEMNTIFRKIRQNLLKESKFSKYLLYAIGEIVLVMIGILLALYINNLNQARANEAKVANILKEIQSDLIIDIEGAKSVFNEYVALDSVVKLILNDEFQEENYKNGEAGDLGMSYTDYLIATNGYDNLKQNLDKLPTKFQDLQKDLKFLYVTLNSNGHIYSDRIREVVFRMADKKRSETWYQESLKGNTVEAEVDYYMNDIQYKNMLSSYMKDQRNIFRHSQMVRIEAIKLYRKIHETLGRQAPIPEVVTYENPDTLKLKSYVGRYELKETVNKGWPEDCELFFENGKLFYSSGLDSKTEFLWHDTSSFFTGYGSATYVILNKPEKGDLYIGIGVNASATYEYVDCSLNDE